jgi:antitoxin VapB
MKPSTMAQNIEDKEAKRLAAEIAKLTGETESDAVRQALRERRDRLGLRARGGRRPRSKEEMLHFLETQIWPLIPEEHRGQPPMTRAERARLLGYGPEDD